MTLGTRTGLEKESDQNRWMLLVSQVREPLEADEGTNDIANTLMEEDVTKPEVSAARTERIW